VIGIQGKLTHEGRSKHKKSKLILMVKKKLKKKKCVSWPLWLRKWPVQDGLQLQVRLL